MTRSSVTKDSISCADIAVFLDESLWQDLCVEERDAVSRHLDLCPQCSDFMKLATNLSRFPGNMSSDELDHAIQRVRVRASRPHPSDERRAPQWVPIAVAASIAALIIAAVLGLTSVGSNPKEKTVAFQCAPSMPVEPLEGVLISYCEGGTKPEIIVDKGRVRVSLRSGAVGILVASDKFEKRSVIVDTPQGTVRDKGTVFTVRVYNENTWIEVFRGLVEVVSKIDDATVFNVAAGHEADVVGGVPSILTAPKTDMLRQRLDATESGERTARSDEDIEGSKTPSLNDIELPQSDMITDSTGGPTQRRQAASEAHRRSSGGSHPVVKSMYDLIQEAQSFLLDRDWTSAAARYREVLLHYPRRQESLAVLINLAKVELRYLGAPKDALAHYRDYQRRAPNGALAEEALFGTAEAYRNLGLKNDEEETLRRFIDRFPQSTLVRKARIRLTQLAH